MSMRGTIPIKFKETLCNIPLVIWIPISYPTNEPMVFIKPSPKMPIKRNKLYIIGSDGNISLSSFRRVKQGTFQATGSPLVELVDGLVGVFEIEPPVNFQQSEASSSSLHLQTLPSRSRAVLRTPCNVLPNKEALVEALVSLQYNKVEQTVDAILEALQGYKLQPILDNYGFNNGTEETLLTMTGTIPIWNGGTSYDVPIVMWLPNTHSTLDKIKVFVTPTTDISNALYGLDFHDNNWEVKDFKCTQLIWSWKYSTGFKRLIQEFIESFNKLPPLRPVYLGSKRALPNTPVAETVTLTNSGVPCRKGPEPGPVSTYPPSC